ncbi:unnamed protein product [Prunus brigantina]
MAGSGWFSSRQAKALGPTSRMDVYMLKLLTHPEPFQDYGFHAYLWVFDYEDGSIRHKVELKSIGDEALFVGDNDSIFVLASKFVGC